MSATPDAPLLQRKATPRPGRLAAWLRRLLLAVCLFFGGEVLLWTDVTRPLWGWPLVALGYVAAAALLIDFIRRFRVYELFGLLVLAGLYAVLAGGLLNPETTLIELPRTFVSRVMGAQFVAGALGFGLFFWLLRPARLRPFGLALAAIGGGLWAVWVRGQSLLVYVPPLAAPPSLLAVGLAGGSLALALALAVLIARIPPAEDTTLALRPLEAVPLVGVLVGLAAFGLWRGALDSVGLAYGATVGLFCVLVLWFQARRVPGHLLDAAPGASVALGGIAGHMAVFVLVGGGVLLGFRWEDGFGRQVFEALALVLSVMGLTWLPGVSLVLGVRAYRQQARTGKLL